MNRARLPLLAAAGLVLVGSIALAWRANRPASKPLPIYGVLKPFLLVDQDGKTITREDMLGAIHVVNFIFTSCPTVCPRLTAQMARLQERTAALPVRFLSFSVDPTTDTPERLKAFGARYGANFQRWRFATGDPEALRTLIVSGFLTAMGTAPGNAQPEAILHGESFVVTDAAGRLRAFRPASTEAELDDIVAILRQLHRDADRVVTR